MSAIKAVATGVAALFFLMGLVIILMNYMLLFKRLISKPDERQPSMIPVVGGVLCSLSLHVYFQLPTLPQTTWSWYALLPMVLDPGGLVFLPVEIALYLAGRGLRKLLGKR